jgi:hypothetical protein
MPRERFSKRLQARRTAEPASACITGTATRHLASGRQQPKENGDTRYLSPRDSFGGTGPAEARTIRACERVLLDVEENEVKEYVRWVDIETVVVAKEDVERVLVSAGVCVFTDNGIRRHPRR